MDTVNQKSFLSYVTVEPLALVYTFGQFLSFPTTSALFYKKSCLLDFNETFCDDMDNKTFRKEHEDEQDHIQSVSSFWMMLNQIVLTVPGTLVVFFFMATWGDKIDRKIPILLPCLGGVLCTLINLLSCYFMDWHVGILLIGSFLNSVLGTYGTLLMGIFSYIVDVSKPEQRTIRVGIVESMSYMAGGTSTFVSGLIRNGVGFKGVYIVVLAFSVLSTLYCIFCIKSVRPAEQNKKEDRCSKVCDISVIKDMIAFIKKKREKNVTFYIMIYVILINLMMLGTAGEIDILYLFLRRVPRSFGRVDYGYFKGSENFLRGISVLVILPVLKGLLNWRDTSILIIGVLFKGIQFCILGFSKTSTLVFIVLIFATLQGFPAASLRSGMSKIVDKNESGRLFGIVAVTEGLISFAASFLFNGLYPKTLHVFDGILFECVAGLSVIAMFLAIYLHAKKADLLVITEPDKNDVNNSEANNPPQPAEENKF